MSFQKSKPMKASEFNVNDIKYSPVKTYPSGAKAVYMNMNEGPIHIQVPEIEIPFDTGTFYPSEAEGFGKYSLKASLKGFQSDEKIKEFHDVMSSLDEKLMDIAMENSQLWFKKKSLTKETIETLYNPMVKVSRDPETGEPNGKYPPQFSFKINKRNGEVQCKCFNMDKSVMNTSDESKEDYVDLENKFKKGTKVKMLLSCNGIWIASGKFGCTWKAEQIRINPPVAFDDFSIMDDSDEEEKLEKIESNYVDDSDDSDNEDSGKGVGLDEPETKPKRRVVRKKNSA